MIVRLKAGAACTRPAPAGFRILRALDTAAETLQILLIISSGDEPRGRLATDPHMTGEAYDLSILDLAAYDLIRLYRFLQIQLPKDQFTVLYERPDQPTHGDQVIQAQLREITYLNPKATAPHLHIQRKKGTTWPR